MKALFALTAAIALLLVAWPRSHSLTQAHFNLLKTGMDRSEIEELLGHPRNTLRARAIVWEPQKQGEPTSRFVDCEPLQLDFFPRDSGQQAVWLTKTGLIATLFAPDGRLKDKYFSTVHVSKGSEQFLEQISINARP